MSTEPDVVQPALPADLRLLAAALGVVGLATCACLLLLFSGAEAFGPVNDVGNAILGLLSLTLAWRLRPDRLAGVLLGPAAAGAALTVVGAILVMTETTGYYLAGLWSSLGFALIGGWLVGISRLDPRAGRLRRAGSTAGAVMLLGLIGAPGIPMDIDVQAVAPWWTFVAGFSWAGTYLLFPVWSLRLAGSDSTESSL